MLKSLPTLIAALGLTTAAQAQVAFDPVAEVKCVAALSLFGAAATKVLDNPSETAEERAKTQRLLDESNRAIDWYVGRLSLQSDSVDLAKQFAEHLSQIVAGSRDDQGKLTFDCINNAIKGRTATAHRLAPER